MDVFVARQPIFDRNQRVFGYELLFRSGFDNFYTGLNGDHSTAMTLHNSFFTIGIETLTGGKRGFVNFTKNLLLNDVAALFPSDLMAVEILEDVVPDEALKEACERLKQAGYIIALDDFVLSEANRAVLELADIVKIDVLQTDADESRSLIREYASPRRRFLAEKVESAEAFREAYDLGFSLFQGFFFSKPEIIKGRDIPGYKLAYLKLLEQINRPDLDYDDLERIFKHDVSLSYKLLRLMNSAFFGFQNEIRSIRHALALLGMHQAKKWLSVIALSGIGKDKSTEAVLQSLIRANLCELIAGRVGMSDRAAELFLMGLFSMIDALLGQSISYFLERVPISEDIKRPLLGVDAPPFGDVLQTVVCYERADWANLSASALRLQLRQDDLPELYLKAIRKSNEFVVS